MSSGFLSDNKGKKYHRIILQLHFVHTNHDKHIPVLEQETSSNNVYCSNDNLHRYWIYRL